MVGADKPWLASAAFGAILIAGLPAALHGQSHGAGSSGAQSSNAQSSEERLVASAIDRFFAARKAKDIHTIRELLLPNGALAFQSRRPDGSYAFKQLPNAEFLAQEETSTAVPDERTFDTIVHVFGPIAVAWQSGTFRLNGKFAHCGTNLIDLVKLDGAWRIANVTWNEEKVGCRLD